MKKFTSLLVCFLLGFMFVSCMKTPKKSPCKSMNNKSCGQEKKSSPRHQCAHSKIE